MKKIVTSVILILFAGGIGWGVWTRLEEAREQQAAGRVEGPAPVEVAPVRRGPIELRRTYSGTLEAYAEFVVAPKVGGRIERLAVDLSDPVRKGQVVAKLDDDEFVHAVTQAKADLEVAKARVAEAESAVLLAERELGRVRSLREGSMTSEAQLDLATAEHQARLAAKDMALAQVMRAEAILQTARIRLDYTNVAASWNGDDPERIVGERFVDEGDTVSANTPLLSIIRLHPVRAVVYATERDYARLRPGQPVVLTTDAYPERTFTGSCSRVSSVFRESSRQARVEMEVENPDHALKPGMFLRAEVLLERSEEATLVPVEALVHRHDTTGVFVVSGDGTRVAWRPVDLGIREGGVVEVRGDGIEGRVVTLGQQLIDDGSRITIPETGPARDP